MPSDPDTPSAPDYPTLHVGRGRNRGFTLQRLRASLPLQICMCAAFVAYGAVAFLLISGRLDLSMALIVVLLSLASWFFLFWWFPVLERTEKHLAGNPEKAWIPRTLEVLATTCVAIVHILMIVIVVLKAGGSPS